MGRHCQLVIGPAGSGKSTYCATVMTHMNAVHRTCHLVNLDPAAESFEYTPTVDIRDLITLDDVMEELDYGPNGGLVYCMEFLLENMDWLVEELGDFEDDYLLFDCPGQIELYTHSPVMKTLIHTLTTQLNFHVCAVYLLEAQFITDTHKYFAGVLTAMSAMVQLEVPHINILSKMDMIEGRPGEDTGSRRKTTLRQHLGVDEKSGRTMGGTWTPEEEDVRENRRRQAQLDRFLDPDPSLLLATVNNEAASALGSSATEKSSSSALSRTAKWHRLNQALVHLIEDFNMVSFLPLNIHDEQSIEAILLSVDTALQYGEDVEPTEPKEWDERERESDGVDGSDDGMTWEEMARAWTGTGGDSD